MNSPIPSERGATDTVLDDATLAGAVRDVVQVLPSDLRMVLYLTDVEGLSYGQAAKVMGTSASAVAGKLRRARAWLRARLSPVIGQALADKPTHPPATPVSETAHCWAIRLSVSSAGGEGARDWLVVALAVGSGALNVISFLALGKVFASVITGNLVLLAVGIAEPDHAVAAHAGVAVAGYAAGVACAAAVCGRPRDQEPPWPRRVSAALVVELVLLCALLAGWEVSGAHPAGGAQLALLALGTVAMGVQSTAVNRLAVPGFSSTFLTSTMIRTITELMTGPRENVTIKVAALLSLITGAFIGTGLLDGVPRLAPALPLALVAGVLLLAQRLTRDCLAAG